MICVSHACPCRPAGRLSANRVGIRQCSWMRNRHLVKRQGGVVGGRLRSWTANWLHRQANDSFVDPFAFSAPRFPLGPLVAFHLLPRPLPPGGNPPREGCLASFDLRCPRLAELPGDHPPRERDLSALPALPGFQSPPRLGRDHRICACTIEIAHETRPGRLARRHDR